MREQVITPRAGRVGSKGRGAVSVQRPNTRRARPAAAKDSPQKSFEWKSALPYVPMALKAVLAVTLGLLAYLGYRTAVSASFFKVKSVDVSGASRASREEIRAAVLRLSNAGVWQADLEVISKELRGLPWVRDAVVTRVLPSGLRVRVTEREPRIISLNGEGRLVWVDDDAVQLGSATPSDEDFFVRGLEEGSGEQARRDNRARVEAALALKADWDKTGLSKRVSEIELSNLEDVRVHLAGEEAGVQVVLGGQDYVKRFRNAGRDARREGARAERALRLLHQHDDGAQRHLRLQAVRRLCRRASGGGARVAGRIGHRRAGPTRAASGPVRRPRAYACPARAVARGAEKDAERAPAGGGRSSPPRRDGPRALKCLRRERRDLNFAPDEIDPQSCEGAEPGWLRT